MKKNRSKDAKIYKTNAKKELEEALLECLY